MARLLVTGCKGQVGAEVMRRAPLHGHAAVGCDLPELDITDPAGVAAALDGCAVLINAAAYTAVDKAESEPERAYAVNETGPRVLAAACAARGVPLLHISTDYVFDGSKAGAWVEDDPVAPLGVYGASKAAGEAAVRETWPDHLILRTSWVYAAHGGNFVHTMLRLGAERDELRVVDDQIGAPTAAGDIAEALLIVAGAYARGDRDRFGTFHYTAEGTTSWAGFADAIFDAAAYVWGRRPVVTPIPTAAYPTPARRPANSVLDCSRIIAAFAPPRRPWRVALTEVMDEIVDTLRRETPT